MRAAILAATAVCGLVTGAKAAVVSYDTSFNVTATAVSLGDDQPTNLTPFNPSLGTLTSASVELIGSFGLSPYMLLLDGGTAPTMASVTPHLNDFPLSPGITTFATQANLPVVNGSITGLQSFSFDVTGALPLNYAADPIVNVEPYATISNANGNYDQSDTGDFDPSTANGIARVSYTYTPAGTASPVPEPASIAMLGLGIAAFGAVRRRSGSGRAA